MLQTVRRDRPVAPWSPAGLIALLALLVLASPPAAHAQPDAELAQAILEKEGAWNATEAQAVSDFLDAHLAIFTQDSPEAVAAAREAILEPLNDLRAGRAFQGQYFRAAADKLRAGLPGFAKIGRINAALLGARLVDPSAVPVLEAGLTDEAPGVRFAAARSMLVLLNNQELDLRDAERTRLLGKLGEAAQAETNGFVAGKMIDAIRSVDVAAQRTILLDVFNARVPLHAADPALDYQPELSAMQELFIDGLGAAGGFGNDDGRSFVRAAARYIRLITTQLAADELPEANQTAGIGLVRQAYTILDTLASGAGQPGVRPADPTRFLPSQPDRAAELAAEWAPYLAANPLALDGAALSIAPAE